MTQSMLINFKNRVSYCMQLKQSLIRSNIDFKLFKKKFIKLSLSFISKNKTVDCCVENKLFNTKIN